MKTLPKVFIVAVTALFLAQFADVASGQDANAQGTQTPPRKRQPHRSSDDNDIPLPLFSLELKAEKATAKIGDKLKVEITITDTDSEDIFYASPQRDFGLEVRDEMGKDVARIPGAVSLDGSSFAPALHPGDSIHRFARLDKEFELNKPGNYFVQATRGSSKTNLRRSNTIMVTIIQ
jgi:hypothetical protein